MTLGGGENHFPIRIYFILALYLGGKEKPVEVLKEASSREAARAGKFQLHQFLDVPQLYEMLAAVSLSDDPPLKFLEENELVTVEGQLISALNARIGRGWKPPLYDVSMAELLQRFSEAASFVNRDEYGKNGINSPGEVLCEARTEEEVTEMERACGPLPPGCEGDGVDC